MFEYLLIPSLAGLFIAVMASSLGVFVVWQKMSYFGDTLAHASLLGLALGFALQINLSIALIASCVLIAILLTQLQSNNSIATDTLLGIIAHSALSFALIAISFMDNLRIDLMAYLFGDLLSVSAIDLCWILSGCLLITFILYRLWPALLAMTVNEELAKIDGYCVKKLKLSLTLMIALVIALAMKFVGALIITSLMIIPAATARRFAKTPEQMLIKACILASLSVCSGIGFSWWLDTPAGPSIVVIAASLFFLSQCKKQSE